VEDDILTYQRTAKPGDIIKSPHFENLLFRDILYQDGFLGFYVNPRKRGQTWGNMQVSMLESVGKKKRTSVPVGGAGNYVDLKSTIDHKKEFVVIHTQRNVDIVPEPDENGNERFPLQVVAKMLDPEGEYDPNGIEIIFHMESENAKHLVPEVINCGFMHIIYKRIF
jgi:hypothetical protein